MTTAEIILNALILGGVVLSILKGILWGKEEKEVLKLYGSKLAAEHIKGYKEIYEDAVKQLKAANGAVEELKQELQELETKYHTILKEGKLKYHGMRLPNESIGLDFSPLRNKAIQASDYVLGSILDFEKQSINLLDQELINYLASKELIRADIKKSEKKISDPENDSKDHDDNTEKNN